MRLAEASGSFNFVLFLVIMFIGFAKIGTVLKRNTKLRTTIFDIIFKRK